MAADRLVRKALEGGLKDQVAEEFLETDVERLLHTLLPACIDCRTEGEVKMRRKGRNVKDRRH